MYRPVPPAFSFGDPMKNVVAVSGRMMNVSVPLLSSMVFTGQPVSVMQTVASSASL